MKFTLPLLLLGLAAAPLSAQGHDSGTVAITVMESMGPVAGALVRAGSRRVTTDAEGRASLVLPAGRRVLSVSAIGYTPGKVTVMVLAGAVVNASVDLAMGGAMEMEAITVSTTRTDRLVDDTPIRVEVLDEMEVDENTLMAPSGVSMLLNETPGIRVQNASPSLGTGSVRILGLPGQYTAMLADGLPLYGGASSSLGPLDISPVDLQRVEIIKGSASALYGGQALGGVINLVSKPPSGRKEVLLNRRTLGVTDAAAWLSQRMSSSLGVSLLASGTIQDDEDLDDDGWADQSRARRWNVRPRFSSVDSTGRSLFATLGYGYDDRAGGTLGSATAPDGQPFRERLTSRRADIGLSARLPSGTRAAEIRFALSTRGGEREFGPGPVEQDRTTTGFLEVSGRTGSPRGAAALGAAVQVDAYGNELNGAYDHTWTTPAVFATGERDVGPVTLSASLRGDFHPEAGFQLTERVAVLARPAAGWSTRFSVGTGYSAPTAQTEETEGIGLRHVRPGAVLDAERGLGVSLDLNGSLGSVELLVTGYGSYIDDAIQLADANDGTNDGILRNAAGTTRVAGVEAGAVLRFTGGKLLLSYGYSQGSRTDAVTGQREAVPLIPRNHFGADLMLEKPGVYRVGLEGIWYDAQPLDDDPYLSRSRPYLYVMFIAARQFGPVELVANFENLLNVRQTDYASLVRPSLTTGGRWTTDVWGPLEGFMANVAVRYRW